VLPLQVNADYESVLFQQKPAPKMNQALEFLPLFLEGLPVVTQQSYPSGYLDYVTSVTGRRPQLVRSGPALNWWGPLTDLEAEARANSKETSARLIIDQGWCRETHIINAPSDIPALETHARYLIKRPGGMSGQGLVVIEGSTAYSSVLEALKAGPLVLEPLLKRSCDFSHYFFPDGKSICYQNLVDPKFQYKGTILPAGPKQVENLPFYHELPEIEWQNFSLQLQVVEKYYQQFPSHYGFSVDSFVYEDQGGKRIRTLSEVNHRRTMGRVAFDLADRYGLPGDPAWLLLAKNSLAWEPLLELIRPVAYGAQSRRGVMLLSPGGRFDVFLILGEGYLSQLQRLLPHTQFAI
jgi:hypothetical protein